MAYGGFFERAILLLDQIGITDVLLPFFLIFTLVFAILQKTELLGHEKKNFNVIIALVMGFAVVIPHITGTYPANADVVNIINKALPNVSLVIIAILMVLLLVGIFGWKIGPGGTSMSGMIALVALVIVVYIFGVAGNLWGTSNRWTWLHNSDTQALIIVILVFGVVVWFITKEKETAGEGMVTKLGSTLGELFKKE